LLFLSAKHAFVASLLIAQPNKSCDEMGNPLRQGKKKFDILLTVNLSITLGMTNLTHNSFIL